jgi:hypothetical protein
MPNLRSFLIVGLVLLLAPRPGGAQNAPSPDADASCTTEPDPSTSGAKVKCRAVTGDVERHPAERLYMLRVRLQREKERNWLLVITSSSAWNFLETDTVRTVIDGTPHEVAFRAVDARRVEGGVVEQNAIELTRAQLRALTDASAVRLRVAGAVLRLPAETLAKHAQMLLRRSSTERDR